MWAQYMCISEKVHVLVTGSPEEKGCWAPKSYLHHSVIIFGFKVEYLAYSVWEVQASEFPPSASKGPLTYARDNGARMEDV